MTDINKDDLRDLRDDIIEQMRELFQGVYKRQDTTNGRVRDGEILSAQYGIKIKNLERELFAQRSGRRKADPVVIPKQVADRTISERDVRMIVLGSTGSAAILLFLWKVLPFALKAVTP